MMSMTDDNPSFRTRGRSIGEDGELSWGGDEDDSNNESWNDAIEETNGITITEDGTVQTGSEIPDSARYHVPMNDRGGTTVEEILQNDDGTAQGTTNVSGNWYNGYAEEGDGQDDWIEFPDEMANWIHTELYDFGLAFTLETNDAGQFGAYNQDISEWTLIRIEDDHIRIEFRDGDDNRARIRSDGGYDDGQKRRFFFYIEDLETMDGDLYINGNAQNVGVTNDSINPSAVNNLNIGFWLFELNRDGDPFGDVYAGIMDNFVVYDDPSSQDIQDDYDAQPWS